MNQPIPTRILASGYAVAKRITKQYAKTFYFASHFLPRQKKRAAYAVYAICRASDEAVDDNDHVGGADELAHVERNIQAAYDGSALNTPLLLAFRDAVIRYQIPRSYFDLLLEGMRMDLDQSRYPTFLELYDYCYKVAGVIGLIMLKIFGQRDPQAGQHAVELGVAMQLTNIIRDIKEDAERGRIYIPQDELARYGVSERQIIQAELDEQLRALLIYQIERARQYYAGSVAGIKMISSRSARFVVYAMKEIYGAILEVVERNGYDVFHERAHVSGKEKARRAWRILWRGQYI